MCAGAAPSPQPTPQPDWLALPVDDVGAAFFTAGDALESAVNRGRLTGREALETCWRFEQTHGRGALTAALRRCDALPPALADLLNRLDGGAA